VFEDDLGETDVCMKQKKGGKMITIMEELVPADAFKLQYLTNTRYQVENYAAEIT
jgi:hypothetical protein